eukprot:4606793-Pyramimonas_sp.AAC.1
MFARAVEMTTSSSAEWVAPHRLHHTDWPISIAPHRSHDVLFAPAARFLIVHNLGCKTPTAQHTLHHIFCKPILHNIFCTAQLPHTYSTTYISQHRLHNKVHTKPIGIESEACVELFTAVSRVNVACASIHGIR